MPEGDTIRWTANRIRPVLEGRVPDEIRTPHPRHAPDRWPQRLGGRTVTRVEPYGKHLFLRFEGGLTIHSHLRMTGAWGVYPMGRRWRRSSRRAWLVLRAGRRQPYDVVVSGMPAMTDPDRMRRVGHKGADLIAPGNTFASFDAAVAAGVDMIEFDVLPEPGTGRLVLAHDYADAARRVPHTLEEGLVYLAADSFAGIELDVDLKGPGYELAVVDALRAHDLLERSLISSQFRASLALIRAYDPAVRLGWSVPKLKRDPFHSPAFALVAGAGLPILRAVLPGRAAAAIRAGRCDAVMAQWRLVTPGLVRSVRDAGGELYVWTVDELPRLRMLEALGVTGVITNDPRLFTALA